MTPLSSLSLDQLRELAHSKRRTPAADTFQVEVVKGLLAMKKAGLLYQVHVHESRIRLELPNAPGIQRQVSWEWAARIVREFEQRQLAKPATKGKKERD